ncbi:MAG: hypothetical protein AAGI30_09185 [Planctomycetota bacterium]
MLSFCALRSLVVPALAFAAVALVPATQASAQGRCGYHGGQNTVIVTQPQYTTCPTTGNTIIVNPVQPIYRPGPVVIQQPVYRGRGFRHHHGRRFGHGFHSHRRGHFHGHGYHRYGRHYSGNSVGVNTGNFGFFLRFD